MEEKKLQKLLNSKKKAIRTKRMYGLKKYDIALTKMSENDIIEKSIQLYKNKYQAGVNTLSHKFKKEWNFFHYHCFLRTVRSVLDEISSKYIEVSLGFNLDEVVSKEQMDYIAEKCKITQVYDDIYPRDLVLDNEGNYIRLSEQLNK